MSEYQERRQWIKKLREFMDGPNAGTCPVCYINPERMVEEHRREIERYRGALMMIAGQRNSVYEDGDGGRGISLDAEEKMRKIARNALEDAHA